MANQTYAPELPLNLGTNEDFVYISDTLKNIRQNLKMIILTNPGEKIMDPNFGIGIRKYLFEPTNGFVGTDINVIGTTSINLSNIGQNIATELTKQANNYNPEIAIEGVQATVQENIMFLKIYYVCFIFFFFS